MRLTDWHISTEKKNKRATDSLFIGEICNSPSKLGVNVIIIFDIFFPNNRITSRVGAYFPLVFFLFFIVWEEETNNVLCAVSKRKGGEDNCKERKKDAKYSALCLLPRALPFSRAYILAHLLPRAFLSSRIKLIFHITSPHSVSIFVRFFSHESPPSLSSLTLILAYLLSQGIYSSRGSS